MSDRPEDYTDPAHGEPGDPMWSEWSRGPTASSGDTDPATRPGAEAGDAGERAATTEAPSWQQPQAAYPHAEHTPDQPTWGYPGGQGGPYGYGYGYGPGGAGAAGPGGHGWQGGHWTAAPWGWNQPGGWGHQPPTRSLGRRKWLAVAASGLTALALLLGVGIGYGVWNGGGASPTSGRFLIPGGTSGSTRGSTSTSTLGTGTSRTGKISHATGAPSNVRTIAAKVTPGLVDINTVLGYQTDEAAGTGMVLTPTGKVLTNNHVIEGSTKITATDLGNGKVYPASVVGYTRTQDVAVIQLKGASGLKTVQLGNSSALKVGEAIVGIGNAGGTGGTPSAAGGSVSALNQAITASDQGSLGTTTEHLTGLIESNADIQPGDSGGPLVTTSGAVVGMDTAASAAQGYSLRGATGQGYSIPINEAVSLAHQIIAGHASATIHIGQTPFLGVYVESTTTRTQFGGTTATSTVTPPATSGAAVANIIPGTPAQSSGLARGDVITNVGGTAVTNPGGLTKIMLRYHPGDSVKVTWTTRTGQTQSASIALADGPAD
ncbi:MAG TPA: S1C family serine protease [Acidimicrobiales bacterium]|nr:S1C family serine protease [Acidimicrobiales bacterium]